MPLVLHASSVSPPSRAVMMLIEILGIDVQFKEVSLPQRDHYKEEYIKKNPVHTIPMLDDDGFVVIDSHAIMTYLVSKFKPGSNLYPEDLKSRSQVDQKLYFDTGVLFPRLRNFIYRLVYENNSFSSIPLSGITDAYGFLEAFLQSSPYVAGDTLSLADLSCVSTISSLNSIVPVSSKYEKVNEWWGKLKAEFWYQSKNEPGLSQFDLFMSSLKMRK